MAEGDLSVDIDNSCFGVEAPNVGKWTGHLSGLSSNCKEFAHEFWIGAVGLSPNFDKVCELRFFCRSRPFVRIASFAHSLQSFLCPFSAHHLE